MINSSCFDLKRLGKLTQLVGDLPNFSQGSKHQDAHLLQASLIREGHFPVPSCGTAFLDPTPLSCARPFYYRLNCVFSKSYILKP